MFIWFCRCSLLYTKRHVYITANKQNTIVHIVIHISEKMCSRGNWHVWIIWVFESKVHIYFRAVQSPKSVVASYFSFLKVFYLCFANVLHTRSVPRVFYAAYIVYIVERDSSTANNNNSNNKNKKASVFLSYTRTTHRLQQQLFCLFSSWIVKMIVKSQIWGSRGICEGERKSICCLCTSLLWLLLLQSLGGADNQNIPIYF